MLLRPPNTVPTGPSKQASGIIGLNVQSPQYGPFASPLIRPLSTTPSHNANCNPNTNNTSATPTFMHSSYSASTSTAISTPHVTADVYGSRRPLIASALSHYFTPEQIKDDLEAFCTDAERLDAFFKEVTATLPAHQAALRERERERDRELGRTAGKSGSSLLRPSRGPGGEGDGEGGIPEFRLPEAVSVARRAGTG